MSIPNTRAPYDTDAIVDIAVHTFLEHGYDGTTMDQLARAADIRKASLYYHVSSKEELLRRGVSRALDASYAIFDEPNAQSGGPLDRLRYVMRRTCETLAAHVPEVALMIRVRGNTETECWVLDKRRAINTRVAELVQGAIDVGKLDARLDAAISARLMLGMVTSTVDWYRDGGTCSPVDLADHVMFLIFGTSALRAGRPR